MKAFREWLQDYKQKNELSYFGVASTLGITRSHVCSIIKGRTGVTINKVIKDMTLLGATSSEIRQIIDPVIDEYIAEAARKA